MIPLYFSFAKQKSTHFYHRPTAITSAGSGAYDALGEDPSLLAPFKLGLRFCAYTGLGAAKQPTGIPLDTTERRQCSIYVFQKAKENSDETTPL